LHLYLSLLLGQIFIDECNVLIGCYGILNRHKLADIKGRESFKGPVLHPADWDHSVDLQGKKIAVIGTGSSAIQIIPAIKDKAVHLDNYARSRTWITSGFGGDLVPKEGVTETRGAGGVNFSYTKEDMARFQNDPEYYQAYERNLRDALCCLHLITFKGSPLATQAGKATAELMRQKSIRKPQVAEAMVPSWTIGCRRLTPGTDYIEALCEDHVDMITTHIDRIDETGIVTVDGKHREYDVIVTASGFDVTWKVCPLYGRKGVNLNDLYDVAPESYLG
jgi:cation diffusion facilitator CzcD-associated flavoprotein CzcO